jgi:hypothetical protein
MFEKFLAFWVRLFGGGTRDQRVIAQETQPEPEITLIEREKRERSKYLADSKQKVSNLLIFKQYYNSSMIDRIYSQIQLIHDAFVNNDELVITKLDQFHMYYTDYLTNLLKAKKKNSESYMNVMIGHRKHYTDELARVSAEIESIKFGDPKKLSQLKSFYDMGMSIQLNSVYNRLIDNFNDFRFKKAGTFNSFATQIKRQLCYNIPSEVFLEMCQVDTDDKTKFYSYEDYHIERKLMAPLLQNLFNVNYQASFVSASAYCELFRIKNTDKFFVFIPNNNAFKLVHEGKLLAYMKDEFTGLNQKIQEKATIKNKLLELDTKDNYSKVFDDETTESLNQFINKIENIDILNISQSIDLERSMMDAVLKLETLTR